MEHTLERQIGSSKLTLETGRLAFQANGAVKVTHGETVVLVTAVMADKPRPDIDFLPLTVEFEERLYAIGRIPGSFFRREGRPTTDATLSARLIDRPLRPQFPKGIRNDIQIVVTVLSADRETPPDIPAIIGASAAVSISNIPFNGPVGATRVAYKDGEYIINPTFVEMEGSQLNVAVAGVRGAIGMVEAGANEVSESVVIEAIRRAQETNNQVIDMIEEMSRAVGKPKDAAPAVGGVEELEGRVNGLLNGRLEQVLDRALDKADQEEALRNLKAEVQTALAEEYDPKASGGVFQSILKKQVRACILERGTRPDGRGLADIRPIRCEVGVLPRTHGSALFTRGQTQVLGIATLASIGMVQKLDTLSPQETKRFLHHYNFPAFSTGETGRMGTSRREIGHGALAERAILPMVPGEEEFPYTIRVVSEVLSSNGSTSMAGVCGASLALMDAGVPMKSPVAGVAMGLIVGEDTHAAVLTDIQGMEDALGDMDFKVAGTVKGINALQMDIKMPGLTYEILGKALEQARTARLFILDRMAEAIETPREQLSPYAPKIFRMVIPIEKIGAVIGPGGRNIRAIIEETGATVDIDDKGVVIIGAIEDENIQKARQRIESMTRELEVGDIFTGKVVRIVNFGAFVELLPGKDGLLRTEEMASADNGVTMGQEITVMILEKDSMGRINLSRRTLFGEEPRPRPEGDRPFPNRRPQPRGPSRDFGPRGDRSGPGGAGYRQRPGGGGAGFRPRHDR